MPKSKQKRVARKAAPKPAPKAARSLKARVAPAAIDPRVIAAISLALRDEQVWRERADQLRQDVSPWTALGRVRAVRTR